MVRKPKLLSSIRAKLFSAVAMLLVAVIMVVSSTYAWFTLSTAPEVTGMSTAIGANGSLEMALLPPDGLTSSIDSGVNDGVLATVDRNITWGNLVDLSDDAYGLKQITLNPSTLNLTAAGAINVIGGMLQVPTYGPDGRVTELIANTSTGVYTNGSFVQSNAFGVRAVGSASGMTTAQLYYRDGRSAANTAMSLAKALASTSLQANGSILADIALAHGTNADATHSKEQVESLMAIVDDLLEEDGILAQIDKAYEQNILAYVASKGNMDETTLKAFKSALEAERVDDSETPEVREDSLLEFLSSYSVPQDILTSLTASYGAYMETKKEVEGAKADLTTLIATLDARAQDDDENNNNATWAEISVALNKLADTNAMQINGYAASAVKENMSAIVNSVMSKGLTVTMATGGGVYADIADHCGDYRAEIVISRVEYNSLVLENTEAKMVTASNLSPNNYLVVLATSVTAVGAPAKPSGEDNTQPLTEMYGYIVDMAFRTNASSSNLLLQTAAKDRIYSDNATDSETYGHGSYMAFQSSTASFTNGQVASLMGAIRIVFFNPADGSIFAYAKLNPSDLENTPSNPLKIDADGYVSAEIVLYKVVVDEETGNRHEELYAENEAPVILALNQNQAHSVSALVYLEGANIGNDDVASDAATSMTGKMNLQFSSSATLVPMENGNLHQPGTPTVTPEGGEDDEGGELDPDAGT